MDADLVAIVEQLVAETLGFDISPKVLEAMAAIRRALPDVAFAVTDDGRSVQCQCPGDLDWIWLVRIATPHVPSQTAVTLDERQTLSRLKARVEVMRAKG